MKVRLQSYFLYDPAHSGILVKCPEYETDIDADALVVSFCAVNITCQRFLVSVECKTDKLSTRVHYRASGITSGDVVVR